METWWKRWNNGKLVDQTPVVSSIFWFLCVVEVNGDDRNNYYRWHLLTSCFFGVRFPMLV